MLVSLGDSNGPIMLSVVWLLAIVGLLLDVYLPKRIEILQIPIYLIMGWLCVLEFSNLKIAIPTLGIVWLSLGGLAYTIGIIFYVLDGFNKLRHAHGIWHLFVLTGSICHFISIAIYVR